MADNVKNFTKQSIADKQRQAKEEYEKKIHEMRQMFEQVASTPSGMRLFKYLFLICGGDTGSVRKNKAGVIDVNETLVVLGAKSVWEVLQYNLTSDTLKKIVKHNWEEVTI